MGTNYYVKVNTCPHCGRSEERIHLGKSSCGWRFLFQWHGGAIYKNIVEMKKWLRGKQIWDEYGRKVSKKEFWELVESKQKITDPEDTDCLHIDGYKFSESEFS